MACCVLIAAILSRLLGPIRGVRRAATPPRLRVAVGVGVLMEIAVAAAIVLAVPDAISQGTSHGSAHVETAPATGGVWWSWSWTAAVAGWLVWMAFARRRHDPVVLWAVGLVVVLATQPDVLALSGRSPVVMMVLVEAAVVLLPLLVLGKARSREHVHVGPSLTMAVCALALTTVVLGLHLPRTHEFFVDGATGLRPWVLPAILVGALAFWAELSRRAVGGVDRLIVLLPFEVGAVIGLASIAGWMPHAAAGGSWLSASADARLAGVVMMLGCGGAWLALCPSPRPHKSHAIAQRLDARISLN